jgi:hypothetical protein
MNRKEILALHKEKCSMFCIDTEDTNELRYVVSFSLTTEELTALRRALEQAGGEHGIAIWNAFNAVGRIG